MIEEWKFIPGFSKYEISTHGRVRKLKWNGKFRYLRGSFNSTTGLVVQIKNDKGISKGLVVARAILSAFVRLPRDKELARHLDDNKRNNNLENLAWGYQKDNSNDAVKNGRLSGRNTRGQLTDQQVIEIKSLYKYKDKDFNAYALAAKYEISSQMVYNILKGNAWKCVD